MLFMRVEDLEDKIEVVVFPRIIEKNSAVLQENKIVMVTGKVDNRNDSAKIICDKVEEIKES
jgi:DNA polymerase III subunit alpha